MSFSTAALQTYALWMAYAGLALVLFTIAAWVRQWGFRFRLVGVTSFTFVVAASIFALSVSFNPRPAVPGAVHYARVFDRQSDQVVIAVAPTVTATELEATLRQAAIDLFSPGRSAPDAMLTIRVRTVLHPEPGTSLPLYLGQIRRSLRERDDAAMQIELYPGNLALLPTPPAAAAS
jgi:Protein of function (DUF2518)